MQVLQHIEYFGTLILTIVAMLNDVGKFFCLIVIINLAFSCSLTPILFRQEDERQGQGLTWAFWAIVGDINEEAKNKAVAWNVMTHLILYLFALISNVLLVNLLIAVMNSTYEQIQANSKVEWAYLRVTALLEYGDSDDLPPPLNLLHFFFFLPSFSLTDGRNGKSQASSLSMISKRDLKESQTKALSALGHEEETSEIAFLRAENADLRQNNIELARRNQDLESLAADYLLEKVAANSK